MKNIRPKFKVSTIAFLMAVTGLARSAGLPSGPGASTGVTSINTSGNTMTINTNSNKSIQNWNSFSVGSGGTVQINQPNSSSIMLNRVTGGAMSQVYGTINSNGGVWLVNPQGIYFGPGSVVNAGSVLLSTLNIADASFSSNGSYNFTPSGSSGTIELNGSIQSSSLVAISPTIRQGSSGVLNTSQEIHLLATDNAKLAIDNSGLIVANLNQSAAQTLLNTQGTVRAVNGRIELTAMGQALAAEALITVGGIVLTQGRNNNIYINAPYGSYAINGVISPGSGGILTVNYQTADDGESEANKKQAAQLTAGMGSEGEKNSLGSGLITDASERQARDGASPENSNKFSENRERSEGRDGADESQRESRGDSREGKDGKKNNKSEKGNKANRGGKEGKVTPGNPGNANNASNNTAPAFANPAGNVPASNAASNSAAANGVNPAGNPVTPGNPGNANNASNNTAPAFANPAGNVPASNAASNSAAANGVNPAGNPVTPGNPGNANNASNNTAPAFANPAGNVPASNAASNSAAANGVNPAGNPVTPGNPGNANNASNNTAPAFANPAGNVPASNAASNSAAANGVNPAGNPVTPGNPGNANNASNNTAPAFANPAGNVPASNAASNSAAANGVNPAGNPVTPGNPGNANNASNNTAPAFANPAGNVPASNAASNSAAANGVNPAGNPVTPGNPGNANNASNNTAPAFANPAGNVPASNAASNSAAANGVNPAGNPVTPGNPGNANNASNNTAPAFANPAGNVPASNAASNSAAANGVNPAGNPTSNILPVARDQIPYVNSQFVTLKPGAPPLIEKGYSIKPQLNNVDIKPLRTVDPVYRAAGPVTGTSNFNMNIRGNVLPYQVSTSENGLQIKPLSASAAKYAESNRSTVLKGAVNKAVDTLSATPGTFKTIYMDFN